MEKEISLSQNGFFHLFLAIIFLLSPTGIAIVQEPWYGALAGWLVLTGFIWLFGLFTVQPNQTRVLIFFGKYQGTIKKKWILLGKPFLCEA